MTRLQAEGSGVRFRIFLSPKRPDRRWGPSSVLLNGYRRLTPGLNGRSVMLTALTSLTSKLRIGGATPLLLVRASTQTTLALRFSCAFLSSVRPAVRPSVPNHLSAIHNEISPHLRSTGRTTSAAHFSQNKTHRGLCTSLHTPHPIHHFILRNISCTFLRFFRPSSNFLAVKQLSTKDSFILILETKVELGTDDRKGKDAKQ